MSEFDFLSNIAIGQYFPAVSTIHQLDPRFKLMIFLVFTLGISFLDNLTANLLALIWVLTWLAAARCPLIHALRGLRPLLPFVVAFALFQLFFTPTAVGCAALVEWRYLHITSCGLSLMLLSLVRLATLVLLTSLLTMTTTTTELAHGTELLLAPLSNLRLPAHEMALIITIALRFLPTLGLEMSRLARAQAARGVTAQRSHRFYFMRNIRERLPLIIPLFVNSLSRAHRLAVAMDARGYSGTRGRTRAFTMQSSSRDWFAVVVAMFALASAYVLAACLSI